MAQEYKCPCCGGSIEFSTSAQKLKCPFCDTEFDGETLSGYSEDLSSDKKDEMVWDTSGIPTWQDDEVAGMNVYSCKSCGGQIMAGETTTSSVCPYCESPIVMGGQFKGKHKPEYVIPFRFDKKAAEQKFHEHINGLKFVPAQFKNRIDDIRGVYVPFWLYDSKAQAGMRYRATKVKRWKDSNYEYTKTEYFSVLREGDMAFDKVPVNASTKVDNTLMEAVEPFDSKAIVPFKMDYLPGYMAEQYDVDPEQSRGRAGSRVKRSVEDAFADSVKGYDDVKVESSNVQIRDGKTSYALYPVWLMNTNYNNKKYVLAMNGQSGHIVGEIPTDKGAANRFLLAMTGICSAVVFAIMTLTWIF